MAARRFSGWKRLLERAGASDGVRLTSIASAIVFALTSLAGIVYLHQPRPEPQQALHVASPQARLPRARPELAAARVEEREIALREQPAIAPRLARLDDAAAIAACEAKLKHGLPVPSSFSRVPSSTGVDRAPGDDAVVSFDFDATNGLGFPLAMQAQCLFEERELARLEVNPR